MSLFQKIHILGLARSGKAAALALRAMGKQVTLWDDSEKARDWGLKQGFEVTCNLHDEPGAFIISPGIGDHFLKNQATEKKWTILSDLQLFFLLFPEVMAVGVTGSNGKSTTCSLIAQGLNQWHKQGLIDHPSLLAGNIGIPIFSTIQENQPTKAIYVLEFSSYQLEYCWHLPLRSALFLNLSPHHLERHGTMAAYALIKTKIWHKATHAFQGPFLQKHLKTFLEHPSPPHEEKEGIFQEIFTSSEKAMTTSLWEGPLPLHLDTPAFRENAGAAYAIMKSLFPDVALDPLSSPLLFQDFQGLPHRQQVLNPGEGILWVNDSKSTNFYASVSALQRFFNLGYGLYWMAGGVQQQNDWDLLSSAMPWIKKVFAFGPAGPQIKAFCQKHQVPCLFSHTAKEAFQEAVQQGKKENPQTKNAIIFSPGCPSFDAFRDFEDRGEHFISWVKALQSSEKT